MHNENMKPEALFFYAPGCAYCPQVHHVLEQLLAEGKLAHLEAINIAEEAVKAEALGVRSVPWLRIGDIELEGMHSEREIRDSLELASLPDGNERYLLHSLETGKLASAERLLQQRPELIHSVMKYLPDMEQSINVRLGISALLEGLQGSELLRSVLDELGRLVDHELPQVRADACHYLGLTGDGRAQPILLKALQDQNPEVSEIARESLAEIGHE